jgi:hypothetical protein
VLFMDPLAVTASVLVAVAVSPAVTFSIAGYNSGTCNGATINVTTSTATAISLQPTTSTNAIAGQTLTVSSNSGNGYTLYTRYSGTLTSGSNTIADISGDNTTPQTPFPSAGTAGFGYTTDHLLNATSTRFQTNKWAKFTTSNNPVAYVASGSVDTDITHVCMQASISGATLAGNYTTSVIYTLVPKF